MNVYDFKVTDEMIIAVLEKMKTNNEPFAACVVESWLVEQGVPKEKQIAHRATDRLIQQQRKAGNIVFTERKWKWR